MAHRDFRRKTSEVKVGGITIGGDAPIRLQSMTNTSTLDTEASVAQCVAIANAGADIVRLTAQGVAQAQNMGEIRRRLREIGVDIPLVADIHFNPAAAFEAATRVEKVRINPGNFVDPGRTFKKLSYTDEEYAEELKKISDKLVPFLKVCRENGTAIRLGVNHGSLSDRIMSRYGDTPAGMVESAMEFLRVCRNEGFNDVVISIKASNVVVMTQTVRLLVEAMDAEDMHYPLHLGVTEAGDAEDGRVKSAVGIGSLLADGIGDTIRVSLSEAPENEIPVARKLVEHINRIASDEIERSVAPKIPDGITRPVPVAAGVDFDAAVGLPDGYELVESHRANAISDIRRQFAERYDTGNYKPTVIKISYTADYDADRVTVAASVDFGSLLLDGFGDGIWIEAPGVSAEKLHSLEMSILQATRRRISKTEYIACPGCGRTLFDLPSVLQTIKAGTSHLKGLKIGVMGCIVNGPGEMADADYGYVGAASGCVSLYKGKECMVKNIPADEALPRLIELIKENGDWVDE
ncbi:MAG: (E)-4-hydroxy-3-methylbut-2-enyl-diphosphate synthase [Muribaculaceae bacterium]|nr:(E)-4-hydroxy-3-methylbut-2-enyl-diphosphate synthase [Muribaculaceae bacterium]